MKSNIGYIILGAFTSLVGVFIYEAGKPNLYNCITNGTSCTPNSGVQTVGALFFLFGLGFTGVWILITAFHLIASDRQPRPMRPRNDVEGVHYDHD